MTLLRGCDDTATLPTWNEVTVFGYGCKKLDLLRAVDDHQKDTHDVVVSLYYDALHALGEALEWKAQVAEFELFLLDSRTSLPVQSVDVDWTGFDEYLAALQRIVDDAGKYVKRTRK